MKQKTKQVSERISAQVLNKLFLAIKAGKINNIIKLVEQRGFAILDQSKTLNGERAWEIAIKKGHVASILIALYKKGLMTKDGAAQIIKIYLLDRAKETQDRLLSESSKNVKTALDKLKAHEDFLEIVNMAMVEMTLHSPIIKEQVFRHIACNDAGLVDRFLSNYPHLINATNEFGNLAHNAAIKIKSSEMISIFKKHGVDLNYIHRNITPVFAAIRQPNFVVLTELVSYGADCKKFSDDISVLEYGLSYALCASDDLMSEYIQCIDFLRQKGCELDYSRFVDWLIRIDSLDTIKNLNRLLEITGDIIDLNRLVLKVNNLNLSVVQRAAAFKRLDILKVLIEDFQLSPDLIFNDRSSALTLAMTSGELPMAEYLLDRGTDLQKIILYLPVIYQIFQLDLPMRIPIIKKILELPLHDRKTLLNKPGPLILGNDIDFKPKLHPDQHTLLQASIMRDDRIASLKNNTICNCR